VYDRDVGKNPELLGKAALSPAQLHPNGFHGELPLLDAGKGKEAFLTVHVDVLPGTEDPQSTQDGNKPMTTSAEAKKDAHSAQAGNKPFSTSAEAKKDSHSAQAGNKPVATSAEAKKDAHSAQAGNKPIATSAEATKDSHPPQAVNKPVATSTEAEKAGIPIGSLKVALLGATDLRAAGAGGTSHPYCVCKIHKKPQFNFQTKAVNNTLNPTWGDRASLEASPRPTH